MNLGIQFQINKDEKIENYLDVIGLCNNVFYFLELLSKSRNFE